MPRDVFCQAGDENEEKDVKEDGEDERRKKDADGEGGGTLAMTWHPP